MSGLYSGSNAAAGMFKLFGGSRKPGVECQSHAHS